MAEVQWAPEGGSGSCQREAEGEAREDSGEFAFEPSQLGSIVPIFILYLVLTLSLKMGALYSANHLWKFGPSELFAESAIFFIVVDIQYCVSFRYTAKWFSYIFFQIIFHYKLLQDIEYSFLCSTAHPCCLSILYIEDCIC